MNAYELADRLEDLQIEESEDDIGLQSINMLRQQANRIAELEKYWADAEVFIPRHHELALERIAELEKAYSELNHKALALGLKNPQQTSAEPVAWAYETRNADGKPYLSDVALKPLFGLVIRYGYKEIPLYTAPQTKPLSFQEMVDCASEAGALWDTHINGDVIFKSVDAFNNFCRAIEERHGIK